MIYKCTHTNEGTFLYPGLSEETKDPEIFNSNHAKKDLEIELYRRKNLQFLIQMSIF
jgi:hypothetical protein